MNKKQLQEMINDAKAEMEKILNTAKDENRPMTEDEAKQFGELESKAKDAKATLDAMETVDKYEMVQIVTPQTKLSAEEQDVKNFASFVRSSLLGEPMQSGSNITKGDNGAIIPTTIANQIIKAVSDISPIFARVKRYNVKGTLVVPKIDDADNGIAMDYADEFTDLESVSAEFSSVNLTGFLAGVLVKVSNSLVNNTDINLVNEVVGLMADAVAKWFEKELLIGTSQKIEGISTATNIVTAASKTEVTADELITLQDSLKSAYQRDACWIMKPETLTAIRKIKLGTGEYILNPDIRNGYGNTLLGKPVFTSDQCQGMAAGKNAVVYADFKNAVALKMVEQFELQVLREKFAIQHATGFVGWTEADAKIVNNQAIGLLKMHA